MKKSIYLFFALICFLAASCTKEKIYDLPQQILMIDEDIIQMGYGTTSELLFKVYPEDAVFNYDLSSPNCQVRMVIDRPEHIGLAYKESEHFQMTGISLVSKEEGIYAATIEDLKTGQEYNEKAFIYISNLKKGRKERHVVALYGFRATVRGKGSDGEE